MMLKNQKNVYDEDTDIFLRYEINLRNEIFKIYERINNSEIVKIINPDLKIDLYLYKILGGFTNLYDNIDFGFVENKGEQGLIIKNNLSNLLQRENAYIFIDLKKDKKEILNIFNNIINEKFINNSNFEYVDKKLEDRMKEIFDDKIVLLEKSSNNLKNTLNLRIYKMLDENKKEILGYGVSMVYFYSK